MSVPTLDAVRAYYDERVEGKIRDFRDANPRIEAAVQLLAEWGPPNPRRILEVGCGIGATSWRMARAWPEAEVIGIDVSIQSIEIAKTCFQRPNLSYRAGLVDMGSFRDEVDLVVLMDTYEHIATGDRRSLHGAIRSILAKHGRLVVTVPTPAILSYLRLNTPKEVQPIDEDIGLMEIVTLGKETDTQLLYYREIGIWRYGDYAHIVLGRYEQLSDVAVRSWRSGRGFGVRKWAKSLLNSGPTKTATYQDYLGSDVLRRSPRRLPHFEVSLRERQRLTSKWRASLVGKK